MSLTLAADVGGTNIRAAVVDADGAILDENRIHAQLNGTNTSEHAIISTISSFLGQFMLKNKKITTIGIGFPGFFIGNSGVLAASPNLPALKDSNLAGGLEKQLNIPVFMQNDALCAAIGEHHFGAGKGCSNLLHITLGTGIGSGLILNNTPYSGESGMAMELGHLRVSYDDHARICGCGGKGCVETYASATAITAIYHEKKGDKLNTQAIYKLACQGDAIATQILHDAGSYLGKAIAEAVKLLDIHTITISGGLIGAWSLLHPTMMSSFNTHVIPPLQGKINILPSTLNDNAGILGAAALNPHYS